MSRAVEVALAILLLAAPPASGFDPDPNPDVSGGSAGGTLWVKAQEERKANGPGNGAHPAPVANDGPQIVIGQLACPGAEVFAATQTEGEVVGFCGAPDPEPEAEQALTLGDIRSAFARLPLPASTLVIQPPDGLTLVNFDTNFYTPSTAPITRRVTLLGQAITIEATPSEYHWDFDDGEPMATSEPGAPYPNLTVTHNYTRTGIYRPSLDTVYSGRYRVGNGPWQAIPGTVTIQGTAQQLEAIEAQPKLVGYDG
jgi:hypothetical protein